MLQGSECSGMGRGKERGKRKYVGEMGKGLLDTLSRRRGGGGWLGECASGAMGMVSLCAIHKQLARTVTSRCNDPGRNLWSVTFLEVFWWNSLEVS